MGFKTMNKAAMVLAGAALLAGGCGETETGKEGGIDMAAIQADGKSDLGRKVKVLDNLAPDASVDGTFDPRIRTYGYVVEARKGAEINITLEALAGEDAQGPKARTPLDTVMAVYGPYTDRSNPGELLFETDDSADSVAAPAIDLKVEQDGKYLIVFASYEDTGAGSYGLDLKCSGTDLQCKRPDFAKPCEAGQHFVQGGRIDADTTWDKCEVILLESTTVAEQVNLTIKPGVTVKGNFLAADGASAFGDVSLIARGTLQAVGTKEHPIAFTALNETGWEGIELFGQSHAIEHAYIDKAEVGVWLRDGASAQMADLVIEGGVTIGEERIMGTTGIRASKDAQGHFSRTLIKGFKTGVYSEQNEMLTIEDSVIRDNNIGVHIKGEGEISRCSTPQPPAVFRDPKIIHTDIFNNTSTGILVAASDAFLQVSKSNIINNGGLGLVIRGSTLHEESFLRENNIHDNNPAAEGELNTREQVHSFHEAGTLDLSQNYWVHISDPNLSSTRDAECDGQISFTGFAPTPIADAGPRLDTVTEPVKEQSWSKTSQP